MGRCLAMLIGLTVGTADGGALARHDVAAQWREARGRVVELRLEAMAVDGDGIIIVQPDKGGSILVRIPSRERACAANGQGVMMALRRGDRVHVRGTVAGRGAVEICQAGSFLKRY